MDGLIINKVGFSHMKLNSELGRTTRRHMWEIFTSPTQKGFFVFETWGYKHGKGFGEHFIETWTLTRWLSKRFSQFNIPPNESHDRIEADLGSIALDKDGFLSVLAAALAQQGNAETAKTMGQAQRFLMSGITGGEYVEPNVSEIVRAAYGLSVGDVVTVVEEVTPVPPLRPIVRGETWGSW